MKAPKLNIFTTLATVVVFSGCAGQQAPRPAVECPTPVSNPAERLAEGLLILERSRRGEHYFGADYPLGMAVIEEAARSGHSQAQYIYGVKRFGALYQAGHSSEASIAEHEAYVHAIAFLVTAARLGDPSAVDFFPDGVLAVLLETGAEHPDWGHERFDPISSIPPSWLMDAQALADRWRVCWPGPAPTSRGE